MKPWQCWLIVLLSAVCFAGGAALLSRCLPQYATSFWWSAGIFYGVTMSYCVHRMEARP